MAAAAKGRPSRPIPRRDSPATEVTRKPRRPSHGLRGKILDVQPRLLRFWLAHVAGHWAGVVPLVPV